MATLSVPNNYINASVVSIKPDAISISSDIVNRTEIKEVESRIDRHIDKLEEDIDFFNEKIMEEHEHNTIELGYLNSQIQTQINTINDLASKISFLMSQRDRVERENQDLKYIIDDLRHRLIQLEERSEQDDSSITTVSGQGSTD